MDSNPLFLTGNTDTVYCMVFLDLQADGPTVLEIPPGMGPGTVDDAFFRYVIDLGAPGPDAGKGGKYLILPPDYKGEVPKDKKDGGEYFVAKSTSYVNWVPLRAFLVEGKTDAAVKLYKEHFKAYPLSQAANPPPMEFINASKLPLNTVHANNIEFYRRARHRHPERADRFPRSGTARTGGQHRHHQRQEVRTRCADDEDPHRCGRRRQCHGTRNFLPRPRSPGRHLPEQCVAIPVSRKRLSLHRQGRRGCPKPGPTDQVLLCLHRQHAQDDVQDRGRGLAVRGRLCRTPRVSPSTAQ